MRFIRDKGDTMDSITFRPAGKQYDAEYQRHVWTESIVLTLIKTVFVSAIRKMQLAVINIIVPHM